jgi:hypothetical protein
MISHRSIFERKLTKLATALSYDVISGKFNVVVIYSGKNYAEKYTTKVSN